MCSSLPLPLAIVVGPPSYAFPATVGGRLPRSARWSRGQTTTPMFKLTAS
jgi:hypothetical protein